MKLVCFKVLIEIDGVRSIKIFTSRTRLIVVGLVSSIDAGANSIVSIFSKRDLLQKLRFAFADCQSMPSASATVLPLILHPKHCTNKHRQTTGKFQKSAISLHLFV